jgi:hypothetical protein
MIDPSNNDARYEQLIDKLTINQSEYENMLTEIVETRKIVNQLFPKKLDYGKKFLMEERMKAITGVFDTELGIRKQLEASIKTEIELRRKLSGEEVTDKEMIYSDAKELAKAIEKLEGKPIKHNFDDSIPVDADEEELVKI